MRNIDDLSSAKNNAHNRPRDPRMTTLLSLGKKLLPSLRLVGKGIPLFKRICIELESNCNRQCFFCPRQGDRSGKRMDSQGNPIMRSMPTEHVIRILDEASTLGFRGRVCFEHLSEPFLDKRLIEMAWEGRQRGMHPYVDTNGDVLRHDDELCRKAAEVFKYIVIGLYDYESEEELETQKQFWRNKLQGTEVRSSEAGKVVPRTDVPYDPRMRREKEAFPDAPCSRPTQRMLIHYDGAVGLCCEDMKAEFDLGNAFKTSVKDIWYSQRHIRIIEGLKKGLRRKYPLCSRCAMGPKK